jgi:uncharacterized protein (UPF0276 family)
LPRIARHCSALQSKAKQCSAEQRIALHGIAMQSSAVQRIALHCTASHSIAKQCAASFVLWHIFVAKDTCQAFPRRQLLPVSATA